MIEENPIPQLVIRYRKLARQRKVLDDQMSEIKTELLPLVEDCGGKWQDGAGYARLNVRKPSVSYNVQALEILRASVPTLAEILDPHRKERAGSQYLQIK